jgi:hypothetical protein
VEKLTDVRVSLSDSRLHCLGCGKVHPGAKVVRVPDGREMGTYTEEWRQYCEATWLLRKKRTKHTRQDYLDLVQEKRGVQARLDLREELLIIWKHRQSSLAKGQG